jgi:aryl-alcohol dehydrogenase-like predicted oxidoreductase
MPLAPRRFARLDRSVHPIGFGAWAIGGTWGEVSEADARAALEAALDQGCDVIDTADVYGDGRSERIIRDTLKGRSQRPFVATKAGRRLPAQVPEGYTLDNLTAWTDRSRANLGMDCLDLVQLHCPPHAAIRGEQVWDALETLKARGAIAAFGVSVETVAEAMDAIARPGVVSVQIIWNAFRLKPAETFFPAAAKAGVGVIARVPLASGLLTGKLTAASSFAADDHRSFNRNGEAFDKGETFSGVPYDVALQAVEELRPLVPGGSTMAAFALRWCLMEDAVTVVIPGAKTAAQARGNMAAGDLAALPPETMAAVRATYDRLIRPHVHPHW